MAATLLASDRTRREVAALGAGQFADHRALRAVAEAAFRSIDRSARPLFAAAVQPALHACGFVAAVYAKKESGGAAHFRTLLARRRPLRNAKRSWRKYAACATRIPPRSRRCGSPASRQRGDAPRRPTSP